MNKVNIYNFIIFIALLRYEGYLKKDISHNESLLSCCNVYDDTESIITDIYHSKRLLERVKLLIDYFEKI